MKRTFIILIVVALVCTIGCKNGNNKLRNEDCKDTPTSKTITVNGVSFDLVFVKGGTFDMGAQSKDTSAINYNPFAEIYEFPVHQVTLDDYYIGKFEVTQQLWLSIMDSWPNNHVPDELYGKGDNYPAYGITWNDCQEFISKLNKLTGMNFRLPTEAEWEFAARGGNQSQNYLFSGSNDIDKVAWHYGNSDGKSHPVGTKSPNELGIYDMTGNVCEWCYNYWEDYSSSHQINPSGPTEGSHKVVRGISWDKASNSTLTARCGITPAAYGLALGFRLVLVH